MNSSYRTNVAQSRDTNKEEGLWVSKEPGVGLSAALCRKDFLMYYRREEYPHAVLNAFVR